jgi:hypothetical protein
MVINFVFSTVSFNLKAFFRSEFSPSREPCVHSLIQLIMSASSSTFPSQSTFESEDVTMTDNPIQPSVPTVEITSTVPSKGKKIITEEDWKWLKPIVSHLYIDKDLTFVQIQTKLRIEHDFYLS